MEVVEKLPCAPEELAEVRLALNEALANVVLHGNQKDHSKKVLIACLCECERGGDLLLVIQDEGNGFDPDAVPDPRSAERLYSNHGRGIFLMRHLMDEVSYQRD